MEDKELTRGDAGKDDQRWKEQRSSCFCGLRFVPVKRHAWMCVPDPAFEYPPMLNPVWSQFPYELYTSLIQQRRHSNFSARPLLPSPFFLLSSLFPFCSSLHPSSQSLVYVIFTIPIACLPVFPVLSCQSYAQIYKSHCVHGALSQRLQCFCRVSLLSPPFFSLKMGKPFSQSSMRIHTDRHMKGMKLYRIFSLSIAHEFRHNQACRRPFWFGRG